MSDKKSKIVVRWGDAVFFFALAAAAFFGAYHLLVRRSQWVGAAAAFAVGAILVFAAAYLGGEGTCPLCAKHLSGLPVLGNGYARCACCRRYLRREGLSLAELADDHVADKPAFAVPVDESKALPSRCCVCMGPSARSEELTYTAAGRVSHASPVGRKLEMSVAAPYCGTHGGDAFLQYTDLAPFPGITVHAVLEGPKHDYHFVLKVRSYAFYREACGLGS